MRRVFRDRLGGDHLGDLTIVKARWAIVLEGIQADEDTILELKETLVQTLKVAGVEPESTSTVSQHNLDAYRGLIAQPPVKLRTVQAWAGHRGHFRRRKSRGAGPEA